MGIDVSKGHAAMDYNEHQRTYKAFKTGSVALIVFVTALMVGMLVFLV